MRHPGPHPARPPAPTVRVRGPGAVFCRDTVLAVIGISAWRSVTPAIALCLALAACDSPSVGFMGVPAERVTVAGSTFSVRVKEDRAEAIRLSREPYGRLHGVTRRGAEAIRRASGCAIAPGSLDGDPAMLQADLDCR